MNFLLKKRIFLTTAHKSPDCSTHFHVAFALLPTAK